MQDGSGEREFNLNKASILARIDNLSKEGFDVEEEKDGLRALRQAETNEGRSILSQMADPWGHRTDNSTE